MDLSDFMNNEARDSIRKLAEQIYEESINKGFLADYLMKDKDKSIELIEEMLYQQTLEELSRNDY